MADHTVDSDLDGPPDLLPLLPRGQPVFADLPLPALVLEALAPAIGNGVLRVRGPVGAAVILVRDGAPFETVVVSAGSEPGGHHDIAEVQGWPGAEVSADRLEPALVDLCAALLRGEALYEDLRLEWTTWPALLADLAWRGGAFVVEIATPSGRGVTCLAEGRQLLSYTDIHPSLDDPAVLEAMAANGDGHVRVRRVAASTFATELETDAGVEVRRGLRHTAGGSAAPTAEPHLAADTEPAAAGSDPGPAAAEAAAAFDAASDAAAFDAAEAFAAFDAAESLAAPDAPPVTAADPAPGWLTHREPAPVSGEHPSSPAPPSLATFAQSVAPAAPSEAETPTPPVPLAQPAAGGVEDEPFARPTIEMLLPDLSWVAPWQAQWPNEAEVEVAEPAHAAVPTDRGQPAAAAPTAPSSLHSLTVADVHNELREIAQRRLQLSASRVEIALESAASQDLPLDRVLDDLRSLSIRGIMQPTIDAMVDEMTAVAGRRAG